MSDEFANASPEAISHVISTFARIYEQRPDLFAQIHQVTTEHLKKRRVSNRKPYEHVAEHIKDILPLLAEDERLSSVREELITEYAKMPSTPATKLRQSPGENSYPVVALVGVGLGIIVAGAIIGYCLGGPDPAPGESVEVRC
jgi:hypothetical protein